MKKLVSSLLLLNASLVAAQEHPNFVLFFVDDLGWADLGYMNPAFHTPNIDQLKADGLYFSRAYVSTATSSPSRASLLTGKEALRCGFVRHIYGNGQGAEFETFDQDPGHLKSRAWLPLEEVTYAERLKAYGYYNYHVGKWHLGTENYFPIKQGFDAMYGTCEHGNPSCYYQPFFKVHNPFPNAGKDDYLTDLLTEGAIDFLNKKSVSKQPFLLNIWYYGVHDPHNGRKDLIPKYLEQGYSPRQAQYMATVEAVDESVGKIRAALKANKLDENTVILFISDQGGAFKNGNLRGGKLGGFTLGEGGSRVPMIIYAPGMKAMQTTYSRPIQTIDVYPTLVEMASGTKCKDKQINGISLVPALKGKRLKRRNLYMHRSYEDQNAAIIQGNWKLIKYRSGKVELFNLKDDESETTNLNEQYPKKAKKLLQALNKWQAEATPAYLLPEK